MADKVQRPIELDELMAHKGKVFTYVTMLEADYRTMTNAYAAAEIRKQDLHADIIDQGRKVQIAASGESKYGAMSAGEYIEWALGKLEGK